LVRFPAASASPSARWDQTNHANIKYEKFFLSKHLLSHRLDLQYQAYLNCAPSPGMVKLMLPGFSAMLICTG
jgi:hypothetical protein